jgi:elongation factor Tu
MYSHYWSWNCSYRSYRNRVANTGDPVEIIGMGAEKLTSTTELRCSVRFLTEEKLEITLVFFKRYSKEDIKRGMVICKPGSVATRFKAEVYILKKEEGGRHTPFHNNYRPQFYVRTTDVTVSLLCQKVEMVSLGIT